MLLLLAPAAVLFAAWTWLKDSGDARRAPARVVATLPSASVPSTEPAPPNPTDAAAAGVDAFRLRFERPPRAGLVFDVDSGEILWRHAPVKRLPVASLTKVMTALLVVGHTRSGDQALVTKSGLRYAGSGVGLLPKGRRVPVEVLLHGLLLPSGNDAANVLAEHVAGTRPAFVAMMNERARQLGLRCTRFASPSGIDGGDRSCAADLAALARAAMSEYRIARIVRKAQAALRFPRTRLTKRGRLFLTTTNPLLRMGYPGTIGLKTGYTARAGRCLIAVVRRGRQTLGVVLLGSPDPARQARSLFARAFRAAS